MHSIKIEQIGYDPEYYPRVNGKEDWQTAYLYAEVLRAKPEKAKMGQPGAFPPIVVVKTTGYDWPYLVLDGLHRLKGFYQAGHKMILAEIEAIPKSKWLERSVELNIDSKRALDAGDKRYIYSRLKADGWKNSQVAELLCMKEESLKKLVSKSPPQLLTQKSAAMLPIGRSNRIVGKQHVGFLKAPFAAISGTSNAQKALQSQGSVTARGAGQIVESFISLLESKSLDMTDEHLAERLAVAGKLLDELLAAA